MNERKIKETVIWKVDEETEREFIIHKFDVFEGLSILKTLLTKALPVDLFSSLDKDGFITRALGAVAGSQTEMSTEEFKSLMKRMLRSISEKLPIGETKVIDEAGNFGVIDMEYNLALVSYLLFQVLMVNYKDFFIEVLQRLGVQMVNLPQELEETINPLNILS